jgi:serine/threonine-protein kinase
MSTQPPLDVQFSEMATSLLSLYDEEGAAADDTPGAIYQELRCSGDRYTDAEVLARGGMKKISRVFDTKTGRQVAMAELRANAPSEMYEPFLREARLTALLEHPNIISVHDIGLSPAGLPFFTMDLKRGDSLADILKKNKMLREQLLEIFVKLCDAISYAHSQKVLHLDLKPDNIQVGRFGEVFICDWGLGKIADSDESEGSEFDAMLFNPDLLNNMTLSGEVKGTPGYMAPEQFEKNGVKTFQTDVYALGCLLYAILTQQPPLRGSPDEIRDWTLSGTLVSPASAFPKKAIPKGLNAVTMKALALKPANRYKSVKALRDDVKNYLTGFSTSAENAGFMKEMTLFYKRNQAACLVALFGFLAIFVTVGVFIGEQQRSIAKIRRSNEIAEAQRQEAVERRREAEEAIARYYEEQRRNMNLLGSLAGNLEFEALALSRTLIYSDPIRALELSIQRYKYLQSTEKDPEPRRPSQIAYCYFIMQDFATANEYYALGDGGEVKLAKLSRKYEKLKEGKLLSVDQLANFIADCHSEKKIWKPLLEKILLCDNELRRDKAGYEKVVREILAGWNEQWTAGRFEYDSQESSLLLRGGMLKNFAMFSEESSGETPLRFMNIRSLDAQSTGLHDLNQIKTLSIESLDIRKTRVTDLSPIQHFPALKTLIVSQDQFSPEQLALLPQELNVLER